MGEAFDYLPKEETPPPLPSKIEKPKLTILNGGKEKMNLTEKLLDTINNDDPKIPQALANDIVEAFSDYMAGKIMTSISQEGAKYVKAIGRLISTRIADKEKNVFDFKVINFIKGLKETELKNYEDRLKNEATKEGELETLRQEIGIKEPLTTTTNQKKETLDDPFFKQEIIDKKITSKSRAKGKELSLGDEGMFGVGGGGGGDGPKKPKDSKPPSKIGKVLRWLGIAGLIAGGAKTGMEIGRHIVDDKKDQESIGEKIDPHSIDTENNAGHFEGIFETPKINTTVQEEKSVETVSSYIAQDGDGFDEVITKLSTTNPEAKKLFINKLHNGKMELVYTDINGDINIYTIKIKENEEGNNSYITTTKDHKEAKIVVHPGDKYYFNTDGRLVLENPEPRKAHVDLQNNIEKPTLYDETDFHTTQLGTYAEIANNVVTEDTLKETTPTHDITLDMNLVDFLLSKSEVKTTSGKVLTDPNKEEKEKILAQLSHDNKIKLFDLRTQQIEQGETPISKLLSPDRLKKTTFSPETTVKNLIEIAKMSAQEAKSPLNNEQLKNFEDMANLLVDIRNNASRETKKALKIDDAGQLSMGTGQAKEAWDAITAKIFQSSTGGLAQK